MENVKSNRGCKKREYGELVFSEGEGKNSKKQYEKEVVEARKKEHVLMCRRNVAKREEDEEVELGEKTVEISEERNYMFRNIEKRLQKRKT